MHIQNKPIQTTVEDLLSKTEKQINSEIETYNKNQEKIYEIHFKFIGVQAIIIILTFLFKDLKIILFSNTFIIRILEALIFTQGVILFITSISLICALRNHEKQIFKSYKYNEDLLKIKKGGLTLTEDIVEGCNSCFSNVITQIKKRSKCINLILYAFYIFNIILLIILLISLIEVNR